MIIKCKMCGGDIEISQNMTVGTCRYCGSTMTLPRIESEKKARLFNRANEYRLNNEFDKAYEAYRAIADEDEQEAEAYWGMILSEYGVEYVEDAKTHNRIPTCHRTGIQSIKSSSNYKLACKYADAEGKMVYQDEADVIDKLQRSILAVSSKEDPYDVFICYKETDDVSGQRTEDSVLAQEIYDELNKNGIRVFFSRISLESHLGENYEPYIYAALKSARVMLVVSTSADNCGAVWVKNEWSRFLNFMGQDDGKVLIPVYRKMSPYEFPEELSGYQAQDMSKVGAIQDLVHGVKKILGTTRTQSRDAVLDSLLEDKLKREKRDKKNQITIVALCLIILGILAYIGVKIIYPERTEKYWQSKTTVVESGFPDSEEYYTFLVQINDLDGFKEYSEYGVWEDRYYSPTGYEQGWILFSSSLECKIFSQDEGKSFSFPNYGNESLPYREFHGTLVFKSIDSIESWSVSDSAGTIIFKDGEMVMFSIMNTNKNPDIYYLLVLEKYASDKRV